MNRQPEPRIAIAVYGTLRTGNGNASLWQGRAHSDGLGYVIGYALVTQGYFPYAVPATMAQSVVELIVPEPDDYDEVLAAMDRLEGHTPGGDHNHYDRVPVAVVTDNGVRMAWMYVPAERDDYIANLPDCPTNEAGFFDWSEHRHARRTNHR